MHVICMHEQGTNNQDNQRSLMAPRDLSYNAPLCEDLEDYGDTKTTRMDKSVNTRIHHVQLAANGMMLSTSSHTDSSVDLACDDDDGVTITFRDASDDDAGR